MPRAIPIACSLLVFAVPAGAQDGEPPPMVFAATDAPVILRHDRERAELSVDGGRSFYEVFAGRGAITAAAVAPDGEVAVARGDRVFVRAPRGETRSRRVPLGRVRQLAIGHGAIVALDYVDRGESERVVHHVAVSRDGGRTFRGARLVTTTRWHQGARVHVRSDGAVVVVTDLETDVCGGGEWQEAYVLARGRWVPDSSSPSAR